MRRILIEELEKTGFHTPALCADCTYNELNLLRERGLLLRQPIGRREDSDSTEKMKFHIRLTREERAELDDKVLAYRSSANCPH